MDAAVELVVGDWELDVDSFKVDSYLVRVGRDSVLIIPIVRPGNSAALADRGGSGTEAESAAAGEGEKGRVEMSDISDADCCLSAGCVDRCCEH